VGSSISATGGFVRAALPQVAVQEFQVNRNAYAAELGGVQNGVINIVSRSGGNDWHGSAFSFLRHRSIQSRNFFDPGKAAFTRLQSGASFSGPLARDRSFFFAALERLDRQETVFVPIQQDFAALRRLSPSQDRLVAFLESTGAGPLADLGRQTRAVLTPANNPAVPALFARNAGEFPFAGENTTASLRLDHRFSSRQQSFLRANLLRGDEQNTRFGGLNGLTNGSSNITRNEVFLLNHTAMLRPGLASVSRASFGRSHFVLAPNDPVGPEIVIGGSGTFGRNSFYPEDSMERVAQLQQTMQWASAGHTLSAGLDYQYVKRDYDIKIYNGARFIFGEFIPLGLLLDSAAGIPGFSAGLAQTLAALGQAPLAATLGDPISSLQAYALGLPVAYVQGFGDPRYRAKQNSLSLFVDESWRTRPGLTLNLGLRYQFDAPPDVRSTHSLAPRFGFAWSPARDPALVVRGGYGFYQSYLMGNIAYGQRQLNRPDFQLVFLTLAGIPGITNPLTRLPLTSADVYQTLALRGVLGRREPQLADLAPLGLPPGFRLPTTGGVQSDYTNPYTHQASLEVERSFGSLALSLGIEGVRGAHLWRTRDHNVARVGTRPDGWPVFGLKDPRIANNYIYESAANSFYHAVVLQANKRFRAGLGLNAHYTFSRATDEATDFTIEYAPHNQLDARADRGLSPFHQKHRFVFTAVIAPRFSRRPALTGWTLSPVLRLNSARPFNVLAGIDNLGDGQTTTHRPLGLGRNTGSGPGFAAFDLRLQREFDLRPDGRLRAALTAEAFNFFNRANFIGVNNVVGPALLASLPNPQRAVRGDPLKPFSYTSAGDPRQFQLGLRLRF
jgi:hypothetical protein